MYDAAQHTRLCAEIRGSHTAPSLTGFAGLAKIEDSARKVAKVAQVKAAKDARGNVKTRMGNPPTTSVLPKAGGSGQRQENGDEAGGEKRMAERGVGSFRID